MGSSHSSGENARGDGRYQNFMDKYRPVSRRGTPFLNPRSLSALPRDELSREEVMADHQNRSCLFLFPGTLRTSRRTQLPPSIHPSPGQSQPPTSPSGGQRFQRKGFTSHASQARDSSPAKVSFLIAFLIARDKGEKAKHSCPLETRDEGRYFPTCLTVFWLTMGRTGGLV